MKGETPLVKSVAKIVLQLEVPVDKPDPLPELLLPEPLFPPQLNDEGLGLAPYSHTCPRIHS